MMVQLENKGQSKRSVDSVRLIIAVNRLLRESLKSDFPKILFLGRDIQVNGTYFFQKGLSLRVKTCETEKEPNGTLDTDIKNVISSNFIFPC